MCSFDQRRRFAVAFIALLLTDHLVVFAERQRDESAQDDHQARGGDTTGTSRKDDFADPWLAGMREVTASKASVVGGEDENGVIAFQPCQDPARFASKCRNWKHLCSTQRFLHNFRKSDIDLPDDVWDNAWKFMALWCPKTCGICSDHDEIEQVVFDSDKKQVVVDSDKKCVESKMSRRRNGAVGTSAMCSCRRRSGTSGLSEGWFCNSQDRIAYNKESQLGKDTVCCCKQAPCKDEALRRGYAFQHDTCEGDICPLCCKLSPKGHGGKCPLTSGYKILKETDAEGKRTTLCDAQEPLPEATYNEAQARCSNRLMRWLNDREWYKNLNQWRKSKGVWKAYVHCMVPKEIHVNSVMLGQHSPVTGQAFTNPARDFITSLPECEGLSERQLAFATGDSYDFLCPFGMPNAQYAPDFRGEKDTACVFDDLDKTIYNRKFAMCPEGHRCACPIFESQRNVFESFATGYKASYYARFVKTGMIGFAAVVSGLAVTFTQHSVTWATLLTGFGVSAANVVAAGGAIASFGAAAAAAAVTYAWPILIGSGVIFIVVFVASFVWKWMRHNCATNVGCYPMDCIEEPRVGCRIRPPDWKEFLDERNPFWFLPPPTYKCAYSGRVSKKCQLDQCSKDELWTQQVGIMETNVSLGNWWRSETNVSLGNWRLFKGKRGPTEVHNCQPMLQRDMSALQLKDLGRKVHDLKVSYDTVALRYARLKTDLDEVCPWGHPMKNGILRCKDFSTCKATKNDQSCCDDQGGTIQCPEDFPYLCNDGFCVGYEGNQCVDGDSKGRGTGGVKGCPAEDECPWLLPSVTEKEAQCMDEDFDAWRGGLVPSGKASTGKACKGKCDKVESEKCGIRKCPWHFPIMCNTKVQEGNSYVHLCATKKDGCKNNGGPRDCPSLRKRH